MKATKTLGILALTVICSLTTIHGAQTHQQAERIRHLRHKKNDNNATRLHHHTRANASRLHQIAQADAQTALENAMASYDAASEACSTDEAREEVEVNRQQYLEEYKELVTLTHSNISVAATATHREINGNHSIASKAINEHAQALHFAVRERVQGVSAEETVDTSEDAEADCADDGASTIDEGF